MITSWTCGRRESRDANNDEATAQQGRWIQSPPKLPPPPPRSTHMKQGSTRQQEYIYQDIN